MRIYGNGRLSYMRILQKILKGTIPWNDKMTMVVQIIKQKIQDLPSLHLPDISLPLILETDASTETWAAVLIQKSSPNME